MSEKRIHVYDNQTSRVEHHALYLGEDGVVYWQPQADRVPKEREVAPPETSAACCAQEVLDKLAAFCKQMRDEWKLTADTSPNDEDKRRVRGRAEEHVRVLAEIQRLRKQAAAQTSGVVATASTEDDTWWAIEDRGIWHIARGEAADLDESVLLLDMLQEHSRPPKVQEVVTEVMKGVESIVAAMEHPRSADVLKALDTKLLEARSSAIFLSHEYGHPHLQVVIESMDQALQITSDLEKSIAAEQSAAQAKPGAATKSTEDDSELEWDGPYKILPRSTCGVLILPRKYVDKKVQLRLYKEQK